jgi:hypothetical protein
MRSQESRFEVEILEEKRMPWSNRHFVAGTYGLREAAEAYKGQISART